AGVLGVPGHAVAALKLDLVVGVALVLGRVLAGVPGFLVGIALRLRALALRLGISDGFGAGSLGLRDADVLLVAVHRIALLLGDEIIGVRIFDLLVVPRAGRVLVRGLRRSFVTHSARLGFSQADILGVIGKRVALFLFDLVCFLGVLLRGVVLGLGRLRGGGLCAYRKQRGTGAGKYSSDELGHG